MHSENEEDFPPPSHHDFDKYLPWACNQLQIYVTVIVTKIQQNEYMGAQTRRSNRSRSNKKPIKVNLLSLKEASSNEDRGTKTTVVNSTDVTIYTIYDKDNLVQLKFDNNRYIPTTVFKVIALIIPFQNNLTNITINRGINNAALCELNKLLATPYITHMCLDDTNIVDANYGILLEKENSLRYLSLSRCKINDDVLEKIAFKLSYPLPASKTLTILKLTSNKITDAGAKHLADALRSNRKLAFLSLGDNLITDVGSAAILDVLNKFPVSAEELFSAKSRKLQYIKHKNKLIAKILAEMETEDFEKKSTKRKSTRASLITVNTARKATVLDIEPSVENINQDKTQPLDSLLLDKANTIAECRMGKFVDPFAPDQIYIKDDQTYCYGNNQLAYINLSYNDISHFTIKKLLNVLSYQKVMDRTPRGLVNVSIEGNRIPVPCLELILTDQILGKNLSLNCGKQNKRRPQSTK